MIRSDDFPGLARHRSCREHGGTPVRHLPRTAGAGDGRAGSRRTAEAVITLFPTLVVSLLRAEAK